MRELTALAVVGDAQHQAQQTLGVLALLEQHLGVARQAQEEAEGGQGVGGDGRHGLHRGGRRRGRRRLRLLLVDGRRLGGDGLGRLVHQLARLLDGHPLELVTVLGLLLRRGGNHWGADLLAREKLGSVSKKVIKAADWKLNNKGKMLTEPD